MGIIRKVKESDYNFILSSLKEGDFSISRGVEKCMIKPIIEDKYSITLIYEDNQQPFAFYTIVTHPEDFMKSFYKSMGLFTKIQYHIKNKLDAIQSKENNANAQIPEKYQVMFKNMFSKNGNYTISLFMLSKAKKSVAGDFFHQAISLMDNYLYMLGVIRKDNYISLMVHKMVFVDSIEFFDADRDTYFCVIDINKYRQNLTKK